MPSYKEIDFAKDMRKLRRMLKYIPADRKFTAEKLIEELAFMDETLHQLKAYVREHGAVDNFKQGKQQFPRESPALKAYGTIVQRYGMIYRQVIDMLPKPETPDKSLEEMEEIKTLLKRLDDKIEPHS